MKTGKSKDEVGPLNEDLVENDMGILRLLGITKEPVTTVTNVKTGGFYSFNHLKHDIKVNGGEAIITHMKGFRKGQVEKMSVLNAAQKGYIWGSLYF